MAITLGTFDVVCPQCETKVPVAVHPAGDDHDTHTFCDDRLGCFEAETADVHAHIWTHENA